jgi:DNA polymerase-3 subunit delta'
MQFGAALLCPNAGEDAVPCHECSICRRIERGVFPDLSLFDLKTQAMFDKNTGKNLTLNISTVRRITSDVSLRPSEARWKVVIVNDVETMQDTAQEAFLKTLEEPPAYVVIVLLTTDADLLLPTILSRCVVLRMQTPPLSTVERALIETGIDHDHAHRVALLSDGQVGWALMAANDPRLLEERAAVRLRAIAWITSEPYRRLITATLLADVFGKDREAVFVELMAVQRVWREVLHVLERVDPENRPDDLQFSEPDFSSASVVACLRSIDTCVANLEANVRPRLAMQSMVTSWPEMST